MSSAARRALGAAAMGGAAFAWYHGQIPTSQLYGRTICREPDGGRVIALTYDDGPNPRETPRLMQVLERHGAKATFLLLGHGRALMRPPYGRRRPATMRVLRQEGYVPLLWSITCYDWRRTATPRKLVRRATRAGDGDVVLLHDGSHKDPAHDRDASIAATDEVLGRLSAEGYRFATVPELVAAARGSGSAAATREARRRSRPGAARRDRAWRAAAG
jgi:peptidoglycan/xylan/chitin deacetylase (PgdA/CDA1 family)